LERKKEKTQRLVEDGNKNPKFPGTYAEMRSKGKTHENWKKKGKEPRPSTGDANQGQK